MLNQNSMGCLFLCTDLEYEHVGQVAWTLGEHKTMNSSAMLITLLSTTRNTLPFGVAVCNVLYGSLNMSSSMNSWEATWKG